MIVKFLLHSCKKENVYEFFISGEEKMMMNFLLVERKKGEA